MIYEIFVVEDKKDFINVISSKFKEDKDFVFRSITSLELTDHLLDVPSLILIDEDNVTDEITSEFLKLVNMIYKNLIKKLSPLINFNNTRLDNQLYALLEKAYRELDLTMMSKLQIICEQRKNDSSLAIGDMKTLKKAKKTYEALIDENEEIILNIKCTDSYNKKRILEDEKLLEKNKEEIKKEIQKLNEECEKAERELRKLKNS